MEMKAETLKQFKELYSNCFPYDEWSKVKFCLDREEYNFELIIKEQNLLAFMISRQLTEEEAEILDIGTDPKHRNKGFASELINRLNKYKVIYLEVDEENTPAINLYKKLGFEITGLRKGYYNRGNKRSNALNMKKKI